MRRRFLFVVLSVVLGMSLLAAACGSSSKSEPPEETTTTTTAPPLPTWPLTGLPDAKAPTDGNHPAISVKMDNSSDARPQVGINEADIVYELLVEGITRFVLVFHSKLPSDIGPVRSARSSDPNIVGQFSRPLFAWSGGNNGVVGEIAAADRAGLLTNAGVDAATAAYYRESSRYAPHNLFLRLTELLQIKAPAGQGAPTPVFSYVKESTSTTTTSTTSSTTTSTIAGAVAPSTTVAPQSFILPAPAMTIDFQGAKVDYAWDATRGGWRRFQVDGKHPRPESATVDAAGVQVAPANVIVMFVDYGASPSDNRSPMAITVGNGPVWVFSGGKVTVGTWSRAKATDPPTLVDNIGKPILLTPGRTWVELPRKGQDVALLDQAQADALLAFKKG